MMQTVASGRAGSATYCAKHVLRVRRRLDLEPPLLLTGWRPLRQHVRQRALLAARAACRRRRLLRHAVLGVGVEVDALVLFQRFALPLDLAPVARRNDGQVVHPAIADKAGCHSELLLLLRRPDAVSICVGACVLTLAGPVIAHSTINTTPSGARPTRRTLPQPNAGPWSPSQGAQDSKPCTGANAAVAQPAHF